MGWQDTLLTTAGNILKRGAEQAVATAGTRFIERQADKWLTPKQKEAAEEAKEEQRSLGEGVQALIDNG